MTLQEYMEREGLSPAQFGAKIGITGQAVRHWLRKESVPNKNTMAKIVAATNGEVMPASFFDIQILGKVS